MNSGGWTLASLIILRHFGLILSICRFQSLHYVGKKLFLYNLFVSQVKFFHTSVQALLSWIILSGASGKKNVKVPMIYAVRLH